MITNEDAKKLSKKLGKNLLTLEECENLSTKSLLRYYKSKRVFCNRLGLCGLPCGCIIDEKLHREGIHYIGEIKLILDKREHVERSSVPSTLKNKYGNKDKRSLSKAT